MIYQSEQIRNVMHEIAQTTGRKYFEVCVVKSVIDAFRNNNPHFLKESVLRLLEKNYPYAEVTYNAKNSDGSNVKRLIPIATSDETVEFYRVCGLYVGAKTNLSELSGITIGRICRMLASGNIPKEDFNLFKPHFKRVESMKEKTECLKTLRDKIRGFVKMSDGETKEGLQKEWQKIHEELQALKDNDERNYEGFEE